MFKKIVFFTGFALFALALVACGGGGGTSGGGNEVTSVTLSAANNATVTVGETITLTATPNATPTSNQYRWTVSNATVAQLNNSSDTTMTTPSNTVTLKGVKAGTVSVTVSVDGVTSNTLSVTVNAASSNEPTLQSVTISGGGEIAATATATLEASLTFTTTPTNDTTTYAWKITKVNGTAATATSYAELNADGKTATLKGKNTTASAVTVTVQVTATYNGKSVNKTADVTIAAQGETVQNKLTDLTLVAEATSLNPNKDTVLTAAATYSGTVSLSYEWKIIKVDGEDVTDDTSAYATLSDGTDGRDSRAPTTVRKYNTLTNTNTTAADHEITVQLTATNTADSTNYITKTADITVKGAKITGIAIVADSETIDADGNTNLTADVVKTDDSVEYTLTWKITEADGTAASSSAYATLVTNEDGTATVTGKNETSAAHRIVVTATATNTKDSTNFESVTKTITIAKAGASTALFPAHTEASAFADTQLAITFTSAPTLAADKTVIIYKASDNTVADTITINSSSKNESQTAQSGYTINVGNNQLVRVGKKADGENPNTVYIQPHYGTLAWGTKYYVVIDKEAITDAPTLSGGRAWNGFAANAWEFTTKADPGVKTTLTVSNATEDNTADYFSVYGAMAAVATKSSGTYEIQIAKTDAPYYELISIEGKGAHIILKGTGTAQYGSDVVIEYVNNQYMNNSSHTRPSFYFKGSGNLTFEHVTLKNLTQRNTSYTADGKDGNGSYQAEALYYACASGFLNAYNSSFISLQDTILTAGNKAWFYGCHIAGDVDFMWGTSDVALFENCAIECLNTSATAAYLFETRVGSTSGTAIGKGYVLYNSTVTVDSGVKAYYARRATNKTTGNDGGATTYYDQVAIVDTEFTGSGSLDAAHWYVGNEPEYLSDTLYGSSADVGWKEYGVTVNGAAVSTTGRYANAGDITADEYAAEYNGRRAILNRYYDKTNKAYAQNATTDRFDVDALITARAYNVTADLSSEVSATEPTYSYVTWDWQNNTVKMYNSSSTEVTTLEGSGATGTLVGDDSSVIAKVDATSGKLSNRNTSNSDAQMNKDTKISIPVAVGDVVTVSVRSVADNAYLTVGGTQGTSYTATTVGYVDIIACVGTVYLYSIQRKSENVSGTVVSLTSDATAVSAGESITLSATASAATSGDWTWQFDTGSASEYAKLTVTEKTATSSTATLTGVGAGTVKVYAVVDGVVSSAWTVTVGATNYIQASDAPTGWASYTGATTLANTSTTPPDSTKGTIGGYGAASGKVYTVSTKSALKSALSGTDSKIIYINGMIDMSDGKLPSTASGTTATLDNWIKTEAAKLTATSTYGSVSTEVTSLATWKTWYAGGCTYDANGSGVYAAAQSALSKAYGEVIKIKVPSNTTIIGLTGESGIKGGTIQIVGATNVVIRNLTVQDAFDPFPAMEKDDGFNAEWDAIVVQGSSYVWIDHCTLQDTIASQDDDFDHISVKKSSSDSTTTSVKYQVFDGLIDVKGNSTGGVPSDFVTVSYCKIANHDKVGIIGHSDSTTYDENHLTVTFHNNYYLNCKQRLPRVRFGHVHLYNNYYQNDGKARTNSYCIGVGYKASIYAEACYFGSGIQYSAESMDASSKAGYLYFDSSNADNSSKGLYPASTNTKYAITSTNVGWNPSTYYDYTAATADSDLVTSVMDNAGAGVWSVAQ